MWGGGREERGVAGGECGESGRKAVGSGVGVVVVAGVACVAVGRLGAELDPEGDLVERYWNRRLVVLEPGLVL